MHGLFLFSWRLSPWKKNDWIFFFLHQTIFQFYSCMWNVVKRKLPKKWVSFFCGLIRSSITFFIHSCKWRYDFFVNCVLPFYVFEIYINQYSKHSFRYFFFVYFSTQVKHRKVASGILYVRVYATKKNQSVFLFAFFEPFRYIEKNISGKYKELRFILACSLILKEYEEYHYIDTTGICNVFFFNFQRFKPFRDSKNLSTLKKLSFFSVLSSVFPT